MPGSGAYGAVAATEPTDLVDKKRKRLLIWLGVVGSFIAFVGLLVFLAASEIVTLEMARLMFSALLGMYVGFGFLFLVYLLVRNME